MNSPKADLFLKLCPIFEAHYPQARTELHYTTPYTLLVAVMLSAQTTDKRVNSVTSVLFQQASTPQQMVTLELKALEDTLRPLGFFQTKARRLLALSQALLDNHGGEVPQNRADLESLPGVGRKTANVVLSTLWQQDVIAVDTHVFRVSQRLGLAQGKTPRDIEMQLEAIIPPGMRARAHHWLILHGRYTCKARRPLCETCCVAHLCPRIGVNLDVLKKIPKSP